MIIYPPVSALRYGKATLSARITFERTYRQDHFTVNRPVEAFFQFPAEYTPMLSQDSGPFAAALLPLAMALGEDIHVLGNCSPLLALGLEKIQRTLLWWYPKRLQAVDVHFEQLSPPSEKDAGSRCVTLFSGGVDSTYTLWSHLPQNQPIPALQVSHALFIHGLDIPLQNERSYEESLTVFNQQLNPSGITLIPCATNLRYFSSGILKWEIAHGSATIAAGLALSGLVKYLLVSATHALDSLKPWGTSPLLDPWLSTETIEVIHYGVTTRRIDKLAAISEWEPAHHFLRVCIDEKKRSGVCNCGHCEKCLRTQGILEILGTRERFTTFPPGFKPSHILKWTPISGNVWIPQLIQFCRDHGKTRFLPWLRFVHWKSRVRSWIFKLTPKPIFRWLRNRLQPYDQDPFNPKFLPDGHLRQPEGEGSGSCAH